MFSQLGCEVVADVSHILEDQDDGVNGVVGGAMVVVGVSKVLEKSQEVGDAFGLEGDL